MKFTKEDLIKIIEQESEEVEAEEGLKALEKQIGRRDFIKKFGLGAAGIIGTGAAGKFWGEISGKMAAEKAKEEPKEPKGPGGGGKPAAMMPGLVPGDTVSGNYPIWDASPFSVGGMDAVYMPIDQLPDHYMMPAERIPLKDYKREIWEQYAHQHPEALKKMLESSGVWAYQDWGFDQYPGAYWDPKTQGEPPQPELMRDPETGMGVYLLPVNWSVILELYQLKSMSHLNSEVIAQMNEDPKLKEKYMKKVGIYDEPLFDDMIIQAKKLKAADVFQDKIEVAGIKEPLQERKIKIKIT